MSKHGKLVNVLHKIYFLEYKTRGFKEIDKQIEYYEKRNLELVSSCLTAECLNMCRKRLTTQLSKSKH